MHEITPEIIPDQVLSEAKTVSNRPKRRIGRVGLGGGYFMSLDLKPRFGQTLSIPESASSRDRIDGSPPAGG